VSPEKISSPRGGGEGEGEIFLGDTWEGEGESTVYE